jgi:hypothetical protein
MIERGSIAAESCGEDLMERSGEASSGRRWPLWGKFN